MARLRFTRHQRSNRYWAFRHEHFLAEESKALSQLRRLDYYELRIMVSQRRQLWRGYVEDAKAEGWSRTKRERKWRQRVYSWYLTEGYIDRSFAWWKKWPERNIWLWFDAVSYSLPEERRYTKDSRRMDKTRLEPYEKVEAKVMDRRIVEGLKVEARRNPANAPNLLGLARHYGFKGRSLI